MRARRATLEPGRGPPHIEKYLTDEIIRNRRIADDPLDEPKYAHAVASEHDVHCDFVALRDAL
jgi:hypothetical protein